MQNFCLPNRNEISSTIMLLDSFACLMSKSTPITANNLESIDGRSWPIAAIIRECLLSECGQSGNRAGRPLPTAVSTGRCNTRADPFSYGVFGHRAKTNREEPTVNGRANLDSRFRSLPAVLHFCCLETSMIPWFFNTHSAFCV